jgi:hypothetical protein
MPHSALVLVMLAASLYCADAPRAQPVTGPGFAAVWQELDPPRLAGSGTFTYFGLRVYDAWLWVSPQGLDTRRMDTPFVLELRYARAFSAGSIAQRSIDEIAKLKLGTGEQQAAWLQWMQSHFPDVKGGDKLTGVYMPGTGMKLLHNGQLVAVDTDDAFARAFFSIWLDERTSAPALRTALLQNARRP